MFIRRLTLDNYYENKGKSDVITNSIIAKFNSETYCYSYALMDVQ